MATTPLTPLVSAFDLTTSYQDLYTVPTGVQSVGIDAAVFNNYSGSTVEYSVRLVQSGSGGVLSEVITDKSIRAMSNDLAPAIIGQALQVGGKIQAKASANGSVNANITGTVLTT